MVVRCYAVCLLLLAVLHVVLKQANAGQEVMQELMKQRQELYENKASSVPPSVKNMIKMKRKNGFLSRKRKKLVAKQKNSIKMAKKSGRRIEQANINDPGGEKLALVRNKPGWCVIHDRKNRLKYKRKHSKEECNRICSAGTCLLCYEQRWS